MGLCNDILAARPTPGFAGWDTLTDRQLLEALVPSEAVVEDARGVLRTQVDTLRRRGVSWSAIGRSLGITRQAAWERFA